MKNTRNIIIQTAFEAIQKNGYHQLRVDKEIVQLGMTKGAYYHYFSSKKELLRAIVTEILGPEFVKPWKALSAGQGHIIDQLQGVLQQHIDQSSLTEIKYGCIFNNLVHEIAHEFPELRGILHTYCQEILELLENAIRKGADKGEIKSLIKPKDLAFLILSVYNGGNSMNKLFQKPTPYKRSLKSIILFLETLRNE